MKYSRKHIIQYGSPSYTRVEVRGGIAKRSALRAVRQLEKLGW